MLFNNNSFFSILGTRCLLTVIMEGIECPSSSSHICNLAMKDLGICATNMTNEEKQELKQLVLFMGGKYLEDLYETATHLVSKSVSSLKHMIAAQNGVKIMHIDWVNELNLTQYNEQQQTFHFSGSKRLE
jgi:twin BRCT domain